MSENLFLRDRSFYKRDINPVRDYVEQNGFYISRMSGRDIGECKSFIVQSLKEKRYSEITNPTVDYYERNEFGDRELLTISLTGYLKDVVGRGQVLAPTFTTYKPYSEEPSVVSEFMDENVQRRSVVKKEGQLAESEGNVTLAMSKDNEQANMKTYNNSLSGALGSEGSVLANETGHNTLTSITRTITSISNSLNERVIAGNRHYRNPDVTLDNIIYLAQSCDKASIHECINRFNLVYPTVDQVMQVVAESSKMYWVDERYMQEIYEFVCTLLPVERAAVVYTQDLYHLRKYNEGFMREFITELSDDSKRFDIPEPIKYIKSIEAEIPNYAHQVIYTSLAGKSKDYTKLEPELVYRIACVCMNIVNTITKYKSFIAAFFLGKSIPSGTAYIFNMVRKSVVQSDTDASMFSVDEWVQWYFGELEFSEKAFAVAGSVMFFSTQCIAHCLALFSANMGVDDKHLFRLAMKPEFVFPVFAATSVAKHYFTFKLIKEGMVYPKPDPEIKGVHLKNSASPQNLVKAAQERMIDILSRIMRKELIDMNDEIRFVADTERMIERSLISGEVQYFKRSRVKAPAAYTKGAKESPYQHHVFWQECFAKSYSEIPPPPYSVIKIPTTLTTPTATAKWVASIENPAVKAGMIKWLTDHKKKKLPTVYVNADYVKAFGLPKEIVEIINTKKIILDLTSTNRMVVEALGFGIKPGWTLSELGY